MLITPGKSCANCNKLLKEGDAIRIVNTGIVARVGGLGLMKDALVFKGTERIEHQNPLCSSIPHGAAIGRKPFRTE